MTTSASKAPWPLAIGCYLAGAALTVLLASVGAYLGHLAAVGVLGIEAVLGGIAVATVTIAVRLPRRARALFVAGALTPVALALLAFLLLIWALANSNFTF